MTPPMLLALLAAGILERTPPTGRLEDKGMATANPLLTDELRSDRSAPNGERCATICPGAR